MLVVPVYDIILLPKVNVYIPIDAFVSITGEDAKSGEEIILLIQKEDENREDLSDESFYPIGVSGTVSEITPYGYVIIKTTERVNVDKLTVNSDANIDVTVSIRPDIEDFDSEKEKEQLARIKATLTKFSANYQWGVFARNYILQWKSLGEIIAVMSNWLQMSNAERYAILAEDSLEKRSDLMEKCVYEYLEIAQLSSEAENAQQEDYQKIYRESAIKKQIEFLQKELDEMHPDSITDVRKFEIKIKDSGMNDTAKKEAEKVLNRIKQEGQNSAEYGMLYDYLDFVTGLNWKPSKAKKIDLKDAEEILEEDHFGLKKVKERIIQQIAVMNLKRKQSGSILLFVGAPGTGKTSICQSIAKALKRKYTRVSLGGVRDEADIRGHRRTYIGAMPGRIMDGIQKSGVSNPLMVLDEVDKLSSSYNGDPASALLEVLDPEQNSTFTDHYMNVPYDLSKVLFICTANTLDTIPEPLLNRMEVIQFQGYTPTDKMQIAKRHLLPKAMKSMGVNGENLIIPDETIQSIILDYTMEAGVRGLKKNLDTLCRVAAVKLVKGEQSNIKVMPNNLKEYLDMKPIHHEQVLAKKNPGIVTGLAWTSAGGDILFIETLFTKGDGKIIITGQLGDVMKESVQIAISLVKSMFPEKAKLFKENDLHIHVPEGAVPKDGPSAGITVTTAISSLVTGKEVGSEYAMTGEVSLRGVVMPIGGLPEKLMAAQRAGISTVFIPAENEEDLEDVDDEVKSKLTIIPVTEVRDVLKKTNIIE